MKIREALSKIKNLKPSQYADEVLIGWLSELDGSVWEEVLKAYGAPAPALPYQKTMLERELLIPFPHDRMYMTWMGAQIDLANAEYERYNNQMMLFNAQHQEYANHVTRNNVVKNPVVIQGVKAL